MIHKLVMWLSSKEYGCSAEDTGDKGSIPGLGRSPGEGHSHPFPYSCLGNPTDRGAWRATVYRVAELGTTEATKLTSVITTHHLNI